MKRLGMLLVFAVLAILTSAPVFAEAKVAPAITEPAKEAFLQSLRVNPVTSATPVTLGWVSSATGGSFAGPYEDYDSCYYACSDGNTYTAYMTYSDCCSGTLSGLWCPAGATPSYPFAWGGGYYILVSC
jgi:hypothetical protein